MLTEEEYEELTSKEVKANVFLEQRVQELENELDKYKIFKSQMEQESEKLADTVKRRIDNDHRLVTNYNTICKENNITSVKDADTMFMGDLAEKNYIISILGTVVSTPKDLKKYRAYLSKSGLYKTGKLEGVVCLIEQ